MKDKLAFSWHIALRVAKNSLSVGAPPRHTNTTSYLQKQVLSEVPAAPPVDGKGWVWAGNATNTAFAGPWGVSYAVNLTSDATGIGSWTEANFVRAIKEGKHLGVGRPINPPMPWPAYRNATEEDLKAVYAYLKTVPPVKNVAPEYQPPQMAKK